MSAFLDHLVARSLELPTAAAAPVVRPRLASRFEPRLDPVTPAAAPPWEETAAEPAAPSAPPRRPPAERSAAVPETTFDEVRRPAPRSSRPPPPQAGARGESRGEDPEPSPSFLPAPSRREPGGERPAPTVRRAAAPVPPSLAVQEGRSRAEPTRAADQARRAPAAERPHPPAAPPAPEERPRVEPAIRRIEVERVVTPVPPPAAAAPPPAASVPRGREPAASTPPPAPAFLQPRVERLAPEPFSARRAEAAAEPVIQVTIGRIEVRATPAPKAPARERPAARPAVDLEEYLRQRAKGERG
jgi:hypothetical protein